MASIIEDADDREGLHLVIPGRSALTLRHLVLDFNGTLAKKGVVAPSTSDLLQRVARRMHIVIATADTFGTVRPFAQKLGVALSVIQGTQDKWDLVTRLMGGVAAIGNGANDRAMLEAAELAIAVIGPEGAHKEALLAADVVVHAIDDALDLFLHPDRLVATLRV